MISCGGIKGIIIVVVKIGIVVLDFDIFLEGRRHLDSRGSWLGAGRSSLGPVSCYIWCGIPSGGGGKKVDPLLDDSGSS